MAQDSFKAHINQIGFGAAAQKQAVYVGKPTGQVTIKSVDGGTANYIIPPGAEKTWAHSGETAGNSILDFSTVTTPGHYALFEGSSQITPVFQIGVKYDAILRDALRFFYLHRASVAIVEPYAESWARAAGHTMNVPVYNDAGSPTGESILSYRGWYDAGDYGRYVVNSGISTYTLLSLYEKHKDKIPNFNIPADDKISGLPQLLSEIKWNLDWMLTMQAADGGVYHKMTEKNWSGTNASPASASLAEHCVMGKTTSATLNFAAVMAAASRIYKVFDENYANTMLTAAKSAWSWAEENPAKYYTRKGTLNSDLHLYGNVQDPTLTGDYGDGNVNDEFYFAAAALASVTSGDEQTKFITRISSEITKNGGNYYVGAAWWNEVGSLGTLEIVRNQSAFPNQYAGARKALIDDADEMLNKMNSYGLPFYDIFDWGSNSVAANIGIHLLEAWELTGDVKYKNAAQAALDYLLGRNPLDQSYVTGFGHKPVKNTHDRLSASFGVKTSGSGLYQTITGPVKAIPGQLAGGPARTGCYGSSSFTANLAKSYEDDFDCYGYNEVTINWNAPLAYLLAVLNDKSGANIADLENSGEVKINPADKGGDWIVFPINNAAIRNEILGKDEDGNNIYKAINAAGNAELTDISVVQQDWDDFSAAVIALKTKNENGITFDLSKCTEGFSYRYRGDAHRFSFETPNSNGTITYFGNTTGNSDGIVAASTSWKTQVIKSFSRDPYDENGSPASLDYSKVGEIRWMVRAFPDYSAGPYGDWTLEGGSLEVEDCVCLGASSAGGIDVSNVGAPEALPNHPTSILERDRNPYRPDGNKPDNTIEFQPATVLSGEFTAGPNPAVKTSGRVDFFWRGRGINSAKLSIYNASGNLVKKINISDKTVGKSERRKVGSWDFKDSKGRLISAGTYVVKGNLTARDGSKEKISLVLGVK
jgi:endoglucanase